VRVYICYYNMTTHHAHRWNVCIYNIYDISYLYVYCWYHNNIIIYYKSVLIRYNIVKYLMRYLLILIVSDIIYFVSDDDYYSLCIGFLILVVKEEVDQLLTLLSAPFKCPIFFLSLAGCMTNLNNVRNTFWRQTTYMSRL